MGGVTVLILMVIGFISYMWNAYTLVPIWIIYLLIIFFYLSCIAIYGFCKRKNKEIIYKLPEVITIAKNDKMEPILIVEKNELYPVGSLVSIYIQNNDDQLETLLGIGYIETKNTNEYLQVRFNYDYKNTKQEEILKLENKIRKLIKIKPSILKDMMETR